MRVSDPMEVEILGGGKMTTNLLGPDGMDTDPVAHNRDNVPEKSRS